MKLRLRSMGIAACAGMVVLFLPLTGRAGAGTAAAPVGAAKAAAATAPNPNEGFLRTWKEISGKIEVMAEDFPEGKYDFKPTPEVRSFAEQMLHVTGSIYYFRDILEGRQPKEEDEPKRANFKSKAEIVAYAKKAIADGTALLEKADFSKDIPRPQRAVNPFRFWSDFCEHAGEHYGQMVVYYRLNGIVPPDSRPKK